MILLAEVAQDVESTKEIFRRRRRMPSHLQFPLDDADVELALCDNDRASLDQMIMRSALIPENCQWATFLRNHDEIALGTVDPIERHRLIDFSI